MADSMDLTCCMGNTVDYEENTYKQYYFPTSDDEDTSPYPIKRNRPNNESLDEFFKDVIIVDVQGFKNEKNEFIIKELVIGTSEHTQIFLIKPPYPFSTLTLEERKHVWWIERNRGYRWSEGHIDYREFKRLIKPYFKERKIIVKGEEKVKWVRELCGHENVLDLSDKGIPNLETLTKLYCKDMFAYNCFNHIKYCALKNVICIRKWILENNISMADFQ